MDCARDGSKLDVVLHVQGNQEGRKAFWRIFGFDVTSPDSRGDEFLRGTVGALRVAGDGLALGEHPRTFDIARMRCPSHLGEAR
ncbi:hypothetical protein HLB44_30930 [Aquincola sp. S2]|uniref:Glyoxalase-like domain-containing protein n=1 Tax=Pseudaquabacterium terrae TaxID=2732868 RepID=A0ABX2ESJ7_9BURK|nr:hypothetical protein [Aquabacterium terrae]NRF71409.1 hypothetical protein [Aquabacterium terrae]